MFAQAQSCLLPMGITSENVAGRFGVTRKQQDEAAVSRIHFLMQHYVLLFNFSNSLLNIVHNIVGRLSLTGELLLLPLLVNLQMKLYQLPPRYLPLHGILNLPLGY